MVETIIDSHNPPVVAAPPTATPSLLDAARGFGVVVSPSLLLHLLLGGTAVACARELSKRTRRKGPARRARPLLALGAAAPAVYLFTVRPWLLRWGATADELERALPGEDHDPDSGIQPTRAITINAPVEAVWPWLAQVGQDRGGFYSYEWLENLAGCHLRNADRVHPEWQHRALGEIVRLHPCYGLKVTAFEPQRVLALEGWGTFVLDPIDARTTRLIARGRRPRGWSVLESALLWEIPHFIMERRMLLGIKERAERAWATCDAGPERLPAQRDARPLRDLVGVGP